MMKNRLKYSIFLILANIVVFAHSFVPHHDTGHHLSEIQTAIECSCGDCAKENTDTSQGCGCCDGGTKGCFLNNGYVSSNNNIDIDDLPFSSFYFIVENYLNVDTDEFNSVEHFDTPYLFHLSLNNCLLGIAMRAPPVA